MRNILLLIVLYFSTFSLKANSEAEHFSKYSVYYTVFNSTFLQEDVAEAYKIKRSKYESLINVSVVRSGDYGGLDAKVFGTATNLLQQQKQLKFKEIKEQNSVYYIAPLRINGEELVHIELEVTPNAESKPLKLKFTKTLYSD